MQGKLTEQLPSDGNAEDLYQQIQAEKAKLIKEGKIKKTKPLPPIDPNEIPFDIPENWKWVRLGDIIDVRDGTHDTPKYVPEGVKLLTSKNIRGGVIDLSTAKYISRNDAAEINKRSRVDEGDILMAMIGTIGNPVLVDKRPDYCIKNVALLKPILSSINMRFLLLYLKFAVADMNRRSSGGVQKFVSLDFLRRYYVPLPPLAEQKRIVEKLDNLLAEVDNIANAIG